MLRKKKRTGTRLFIHYVIWHFSRYRLDIYSFLFIYYLFIIIIIIIFQECAFNKLKSYSALKVSFQGNMRVSGDNQCNRWYFKFNGNECSGPMTIEAAVYNDWYSGNPHLLHHRSFEGYCENLLQGAVRVKLWVGQCSDRTLGDAHTGWNSVSRIMIEEVSRPQS